VPGPSQVEDQMHAAIESALGGDGGGVTMCEESKECQADQSGKEALPKNKRGNDKSMDDKADQSVATEEVSAEEVQKVSLATLSANEVPPAPGEAQPKVRKGSGKGKGKTGKADQSVEEEACTKKAQALPQKIIATNDLTRAPGEAQAKMRNGNGKGKKGKADQSGEAELHTEKVQDVPQETLAANDLAQVSVEAQSKKRSGSGQGKKGNAGTKGKSVENKVSPDKVQEVHQETLPANNVTCEAQPKQKRARKDKTGKAYQTVEDLEVCQAALPKRRKHNMTPKAGSTLDAGIPGEMVKTDGKKAPMELHVTVAGVPHVHVIRPAVTRPARQAKAGKALGGAEPQKRKRKMKKGVSKKAGHIEGVVGYGGQGREATGLGKRRGKKAAAGTGRTKKKASRTEIMASSTLRVPRAPGRTCLRRMATAPNMRSLNQLGRAGPRIARSSCRHAPPRLQRL